MLAVTGLQAWYGESQVLQDVALEVREGEIVTLVGRNGAGKTTTLKCIMGIHRQKRGTILLDGVNLGSLSPQRIAQKRIGYVQDDRGIFSRLSVLENLLLPPLLTDTGWSLDRIYSVFPVLRERAQQAGSTLSGGEQQLLAIARVLRMGARLLVMDEPTEGLAPLLVRRIGDILREIKGSGLTVLLVEQNLRFATTVADRHYLISNGKTVASLSNEEMSQRERELLEHLGV